MDNRSKTGASIGILGGGIAGLSLATFLNGDLEVLEKDDRTGGLCRSYEKDGFTYDQGGHIIFSKDQEVLDLELKTLGENSRQLYRRANCWFKGRLVKYPFENGLGALDKEDIYDCLANFLNNPPREQHCFEDWIYNTFGKGFAEQYLLPYNRKIWKTEPRDMDVQWVERIPKPPADDIIKSALGIETEGYTHQLYFHYPKVGGFESLPRAFEAKAQEKHRIIRNFAVRRISRQGGKWHVQGESDERVYDKIISTMPIFDLLAALENVPEPVQKAVNGLVYNSLVVVMVGLSVPRKVDTVCVYFPQPEHLFHRLVFFDYFGQNYVPEDCSSMVAEITYKEGDQTSKMSDKEIADHVVGSLAKDGFLETDKVVTVDVKRIKYAYVVYDKERRDNLKTIFTYLQSLDIDVCGRFAEFEYYNSDQVIRSALNLAKKLNERVPA